VTSCGAFNEALADEKFCADIAYDGSFRGINVAAYCNCPGSTFPVACGRGLCNDGTSLVDGTMFGLSCNEWDDFALAASTSDACGSMLDPQRESCCL
jgi:hypothetical protein